MWRKRRSTIKVDGIEAIWSVKSERRRLEDGIHHEIEERVGLDRYWGNK